MSNKLITELKSKLGVREVLVLVLLIITLILWANILLTFLHSETEPANKKKKTNQLREEGSEELTTPPQFDTKKIYKLKKRIRESPFLADKKKKPEFSYSDKEKKEEKEKANNKPKLLIEQDLYLTGIAEANNNRLAITRDKEKSYVLKVGSSIHGFEVVKIKERQVILKKEEQLYKLKSELEIY